MRIDTLLYSCSACYEVSHSIQTVQIRYIESKRHSEFFIDISYRVNVYTAGVETSSILLDTSILIKLNIKENQMHLCI